MNIRDVSADGEFFKRELVEKTSIFQCQGFENARDKCAVSNIDIKIRINDVIGCLDNRHWRTNLQPRMNARQSC